MAVVIDIIDAFIVVDVLIWVCWVDIRIEVGIVLLWMLLWVLIIILWWIILLLLLIMLIVVIIVIHLITTPSRSHPLPNNIKRVSCCCCRWYWVIVINIVVITTDAIIRTLPKYLLSLSLLLFPFFLFLLSNLLPIGLSHHLQLLLLYSKRHHRHYLFDQILHRHYLMLLQIS